MEKNKSFQKLIKNDKYQVFIFSCPAYLPFVFAKHPWIVLNKKGVISRWEIRDYKNNINKDFQYLHLNDKPPFQGINISFFIEKYFWDSELISLIEGDENSPTCKVIEFVENSYKNYPYLSQYSILGPNSNTYIQWILDEFPELNIQLSWQFIGKEFKINQIK